MTNYFFGTMTVIVSAAQGSIPLAGFRVRIRGADEENRDVDIVSLTDRSGKTEIIKLPSVSSDLSEKPNPASQAFYTYNIAVEGSGYYESEIFAVPVFEGIHTLQNITMIPEQIYSSDTEKPKGNTDFLITTKEEDR